MATRSRLHGLTWPPTYDYDRNQLKSWASAGIFPGGGANPKCEARSAEHAKARSAEPRRREAPSQFGGEGFGEGVSLSPLPKKILLIDISNGAI